MFEITNYLTYFSTTSILLLLLSSDNSTFQDMIEEILYINIVLFTLLFQLTINLVFIFKYYIQLLITSLIVSAFDFNICLVKPFLSTFVILSFLFFGITIYKSNSSAIIAFITHINGLSNSTKTMIQIHNNEYGKNNISLSQKKRISLRLALQLYILQTLSIQTYSIITNAL